MEEAARMRGGALSHRRTLLLLAAVVSAALWAAGPAAAIPPQANSLTPEDGPPAAGHQHGENTGHLPAGRENVRLISKLELTDKVDGIADVGYFDGYAYLNAWGPNCTSVGGTGAGVHVVDVRNPERPRKVGFLPAEPNGYPGEGIHVMSVNSRFFRGDLLVHNNEACNTQAPSTLGFSMWDVSNPRSPVKLGQFGDTVPAPFLFSTGLYHSNHSVQGFTLGRRAFVVVVDNEEAFGPPFKDVDIFDVTNPAAPVLASETGLEDWPGAQGSYANGDAVNNHDIQFKIVRGRPTLVVSYWDAGQIQLDVSDPYNPRFIGDSDYRTPDPLMPQFQIPEGNSHESYWSSNSRWLISTDEDFSPFRTNFRLTTGPNMGPYGAGEFGFTPLIADRPDGRIAGPTVYGGRGCIAAGPNAGPDAVAGEPSPPPASAIPAEPGEEKTVVFSRGTCFFSTKIAAGQDLGYDVVIIQQSHGGTRNGLLPDGFSCGGQGHQYDERIPAICLGHRATHLMFNDTPQYTDPAGEGRDIPLGTLGEKYEATTDFVGWGYVQLHDARDPNLRIVDSYAVDEALDERFASGFGDLSVHEVKTDPRRGVNLAYFSYYAAGFRVAEFGRRGIEEVGFFIDEGGNNFWGVFPIGDETAGHGYRSDRGRGEGRRPTILLSDRDFGLYVVRYTGDEPGRDRGDRDDDDDDRDDDDDDDDRDRDRDRDRDDDDDDDRDDDD
jgi:hypothetical protein